jgi:alanyl-tRNA synthetase
MTEKLYYTDPYTVDFTASIIDVKQDDNMFHVLLGKTAFYPEGGGQPCDLGHIDGVPVTYVYEEGGLIFHVLERLPMHTTDIECKIDWMRRFDFMQQHSGQHILSGSFEKTAQAETVGFHLSEQTVTIDLDKMVDSEIIEKTELLANQTVFDNVIVETFYPAPEDINRLNLRKLPDIFENLRIVKIGEFDIIPCCGTHVSRTGEIGLIKIKRWEKQRDGMRVEFACGYRALRDYFIKNQSVHTISSILCIRDTEIVDGVKRIKEEMSGLEEQNRLLKEQVMEYEIQNFLISAETVASARVIKNVFENRDFNEVKLLASKLASQPGVAVLFGIKNENKAQLIFTRDKALDKVKMNDVLKKYMHLIDGSGGGNSASAQGGGKCTDRLDLAIKLSYEEIINILKLENK